MLLYEMIMAQVEISDSIADEIKLIIYSLVKTKLRNDRELLGTSLLDADVQDVNGELTIDVGGAKRNVGTVHDHG